MTAESLGGEPVNAHFFQAGLAELAGTATTPSALARLRTELVPDSSVPLTRGSACRLMFAALGHQNVPSVPSRLARPAPP